MPATCAHPSRCAASTPHPVTSATSLIPQTLPLVPDRWQERASRAAHLQIPLAQIIPGAQA
jgi:hypothetical protein